MVFRLSALFRVSGHRNRVQPSLRSHALC
ncbi:hypothetical protein BIW11_06789, partial [Tropilaelaps mercedesae]